MLNVFDTVHGADAGDAGITNEPSSKCTLWNPLVLFHVTVSPTLIATCLGVNKLKLFAVTVTVAAGAAAAGTSAATRMPNPSKRILMCRPYSSVRGPAS